MRKLVLTAATAAFGLGIAAPAFAQDSDRAPFTGPRVEALVGYDHIKGGRGSGSSSDGLVYGGAAGYDAQLGGVVVGVEGEITGATTDTRSNGLLVSGDRLRVSAGRDLYAGARLGYVVGPRTLIYAKAGYTNARVEENYTTGTKTIEDHQNLDGYRVGAGAEYKIGPTTYVKAEYRYSNYNDIDGYKIDVDRHQVLAGVGVRF